MNIGINLNVSRFWPLWPCFFYFFRFKSHTRWHVNAKFWSWDGWQHWRKKKD